MALHRLFDHGDEHQPLDDAGGVRRGVFVGHGRGQF